MQGMPVLREEKQLNKGRNLPSCDLQINAANRRWLGCRRK
jgi:hypothetical protein